MTAQVPDQFYYKEMKLDLVGIRGNELPIPYDFGIKTPIASTACWRGYVMRYKIMENRLVLDGFWFNSENEDLPQINGISPLRIPRDIIETDRSMRRMFKYKYLNLNKTIEFTGSIWLAKDFIDSEYIHMGFQSPTAYRTVLKFDFEDGIIVNVEDKSKETEESRERGGCKASKPNSMSPGDLEDWVMKRFSLDIDFYQKNKNED